MEFAKEMAKQIAWGMAFGVTWFTLELTFFYWSIHHGGLCQ